MKVLNLECGHGHVFEGWFASEEDFVSQHSQAQLQCPLCGDATVTKRLSAPHVLRSGKRGTGDVPIASNSADSQVSDVTVKWMSVARQIVAQTSDVGSNFAEEARKIHYGEAPERGIRGTATFKETQALLEEGVSVLPFPLPLALKEPLQ